jgi:hypothetical protein
LRNWELKQYHGSGVPPYEARVEQSCFWDLICRVYCTGTSVRFVGFCCQNAKNLLLFILAVTKVPQQNWAWTLSALVEQRVVSMHWLWLIAGPISLRFVMHYCHLINWTVDKTYGSYNARSRDITSGHDWDIWEHAYFHRKK